MGAQTKFPLINSTVAREFDAALQEINSELEGGIGFSEVFRNSEHQAALYDGGLLNRIRQV